MCGGACKVRNPIHFKSCGDEMSLSWPTRLPLPTIFEAWFHLKLADGADWFAITLHVGLPVSIRWRSSMTLQTDLAAAIAKVTADSTLLGEEVSRLPAFRIAQRGLGLVPEGRRIFPNLAVQENLAAAAANRCNASPSWTLDALVLPPSRSSSFPLPLP